MYLTQPRGEKNRRQSFAASSAAARYVYYLSISLGKCRTRATTPMASSARSLSSAHYVSSRAPKTNCQRRARPRSISASREKKMRRAGRSIFRPNECGICLRKHLVNFDGWDNEMFILGLLPPEKRDCVVNSVRNGIFFKKITDRWGFLF